MPLLPGAEPYEHQAGPVGALLCHGFTSTPQSLRPWAEALAAAGVTVALPRLPGHGTSWREMARTRWEDWYAELEVGFERLRTRCDAVFVMGQSLGGCLALRLAELHGEEVSGVVIVNPSLHDSNRLWKIATILKLFVPSIPGLAGDIRLDGARELAYDRIPVKAAATLPRLWALTLAELDAITAPALVFKSREDHVVGPESLQRLREGMRGERLKVRFCENSFHVATLDHDAEMIAEESLEFVRAHAPVLGTPEDRSD